MATSYCKSKQKRWHHTYMCCKNGKPSTSITAWVPTLNQHTYKKRLHGKRELHRSESEENKRLLIARKKTNYNSSIYNIGLAYKYKYSNASVKMCRSIVETMIFPTTSTSCFNRYKPENSRASYNINFST